MAHKRSVLRSTAMMQAAFGVSYPLGDFANVRMALAAGVLGVITDVHTGETMLKLKITTVGNSAGVVLPKEALQRMKAKKGDHLYLVETPDGYEISPYDKDFAEQIESAERVMGRYRNALKSLAK